MNGKNPFGILEARPSHARPVELWLCERSDGWVCHVPELPSATVHKQPSEDQAYQRSRDYIATIVTQMRKLKRPVDWKPKPATPPHVKVRRLRVAELNVKDLK